MADHVVVGVDGSMEAAEAVEWAVDDAVLRGLPLRIVHAVEMWAYDMPARSVESLADALQLNASRVLADAEERARKRAPGADIGTAMIDGPPVRVLREAAHQAVELVVGHRGVGGFAGAVLGSVSMQVAGHAHGTVVVVRGRPPAREEGAGEDIVVGVDDSDNCEPALAYAMEQARLRGSPVRALHAWQPPAFAFIPQLSPADLTDLRTAHQKILDERLEPWRERHPDLLIVPDLWHAHPVEALVEASKNAHMVVVGSHGRGALRTTLLGSVSRGVLARASCTVAVARRRD